MFKQPLLGERGGVTGVHEDPVVTFAAVHATATDGVVQGLVLAVLPQLVALHAVTVVEGDRAGVGDGVKAELLGVLGVSGPDVLSPGEGEYLCTQEHHAQESKARRVSFLSFQKIMKDFKHRGPQRGILTILPLLITLL